MRPALLLGAVLLGGCGGLPQWLSSETSIEVREVGRSLYCNTAGEDAQVVLLDEPQAVLDWQASRGIQLAGSESLVRAPYAVVEMGLRPTGGYGLAVARAAVLRDEQVTLSATFVAPPPGRMRTQALSSPCVLVQLPPGRYEAILVRDQTGEIRTVGGRPVPLADGAPVVPAEEAPASIPEAEVPASEAPEPDAPAGEASASPDASGVPPQ